MGYCYALKIPVLQGFSLLKIGVTRSPNGKSAQSFRRTARDWALFFVLSQFHRKMTIAIPTI